MKTEVLQPEGLSNRAPRLRIAWDAARVGITGPQLEKYVYDTDPRIVLAGSTGPGGGGFGRRAGGAENSVTIMPYMMIPGDEKVVGERLYQVLSKPPALPKPAESSGAPAQVAGQWDVHIEYVYGASEHGLFLEQNGDVLTGAHHGDLLSGDLRGSVQGDRVSFRSSMKYEGTRLGYAFEGRLENNVLSGTVEMGEYGSARWTAKRHQYGMPGGLVRPVKNV